MIEVLLNFITSFCKITQNLTILHFEVLCRNILCLSEQNEKNEKYKKNEEEENVKKILIINKKIFEVLEQIEKELTIKIKNLKKVKKSNKKVDKKIQEFRDKHSISEEDASDEKIKEYLKLYNNDELKACEEILRSILGEKNNKIKK